MVKEETGGLIDEHFEQYVKDHLNEFVEDVKELVSQPSVSARNQGIEECALLVEKMMQDIGVKTRIFRRQNVAPVVYGEIKSNRSSKTVLFYNHYDVQPEEPLELWKSPPFRPEVRDGRLFGRGASDDKGELVSRLKLLQGCLEVYGEPPCNMKFCFEGEEEVGSPHLNEYVSENQELLKSDAVIWEMGRADGQDRPVVALGMKGMIYLELVVKSLERDAHSSYAAALPSAAWRMVKLLSLLKDENERILIPGWYDGVETLSEGENSVLEEQPFSGESFKNFYGARSFVNGMTDSQAKKALVRRPTANIAGIWAGYAGPGSKTVLPKEIHCKMDLRLVPNQDPEDLLSKFKAFLVASGYQDVELTVDSMEPAARTSYEDPLVQATVKAGESVYGKKCVVKLSDPGTGPLFAFTQRYKTPAVSIGVSSEDNEMHAPNENLRLDLFEKGIVWLAQTLENYLA